MINAFVRFFLENRLVVWLLLLLFLGWGLATAPFEFDIPGLPRDPVAVDAIPDIGENQQIVFTQWMGQSPQDVEDQITYPLTSSLLGIPGVKSVRSNSMFGFSSIYLIFEEDVEFYWSRSRILEKLNSLPTGLLPENATPTLGPDATALGQVFWYTLEGRAPDGTPVGGWDLDELRSIQDFYVRYGLSAAGGVSEVASIGGFVKEYQVDVDPEKMRVYDITLGQVMAAVKGSNLDVGAATLEINLAEYFVRGLGYLQNLDDLELAVVSEKNNVPVYLRDIARVTIGPAARRGILDKSGAEAVGGVVVARYGANPLEVINNVKAKIGELAPGLPKRKLADGTVSQVTVVPFYDRSELIRETIGTLEEALTLEILITAIVVILLLFNLKSSLLVAGTLPVAVLMCFIAMRYFGVDANIVALSGIAIAIGTMVDMGIVLTESMVYRITSGLSAGDRVVVNGAFQIDASAQLNNKASMMNRDVLVQGQLPDPLVAEEVPDYREDTPEAFRTQLGKVVEAYLPLKDRMVATELADETLLTSLREILAKVDMMQVKGDAHVYWMKQLDALDAHAKKMGQADDVEAQRKQFGFLSQALINALTAFGVDGKYYVQHCPMAFDNAGANWLSNEEQIRNPYFGDLMMKCGMVTDELYNQGG